MLFLRSWSYCVDRLKIINCGNYYTIANINGNQENHCHVNKQSTAELLCKLITRKEVPKSSYLRESAKRVTLDEKYKEKIEIKEEKDRNKQYYYNPQKGVRKR